jgi:14-3-3 protein epsilon
MASVSEGASRKKSSDSALEAYMNASSLAVLDLKCSHPDRLRLALNYSTFLHDIAEKKDRACHTAKCAFDDALAEIDTQVDDPHPDSTRLMGLLREKMVSQPSNLPRLDFLTGLTRANGFRVTKLTKSTSAMIYS